MSDLQINDALALAQDLTDIRAIYGSECEVACKNALRQTDSEDWRSVISATVMLYERRRRATFGPSSLAST